MNENGRPRSRLIGIVVRFQGDRFNRAEPLHQKSTVANAEPASPRSSAGALFRVYRGTRQQRKRKTEKEIRWKNEAIVESCRARSPRFSFFCFALFFRTLPLFWACFFPDRLSARADIKEPDHVPRSMESRRGDPGFSRRYPALARTTRERFSDGSSHVELSTIRYSEIMIRRTFCGGDFEGRRPSSRRFGDRHLETYPVVELS